MYGNITYETVSDVESAVRNMKDDLDNKPTTWCGVKPMINPKTIILSTGSVVGWDSDNPLTDTQIKALSKSDKVYNVYSVHEGYNFTAIVDMHQDIDITDDTARDKDNARIRSAFTNVT